MTDRIRTEQDTRYERTEEDLRDAFRILAARKELSAITVSEITRITGITRTTFYNHYVDMPSFIEAMEDQILDEMFHMIREFRAHTNAQLCRDFFRSLCVYIEQNRFLARILVTPRADVFVEKALKMLRRYASGRLEEDRPVEAERASIYRIAYSIGGIVGVLHRWAADECEDSPEAVAEYLTRLFLYNSPSSVH